MINTFQQKKINTFKILYKYIEEGFSTTAISRDSKLQSILPNELNRKKTTSVLKISQKNYQQEKLYNK